jgi:hypothetical protein
MFAKDFFDPSSPEATPWHGRINRIYRIILVHCITITFLLIFSMQREALLTNAVMLITQLFNEGENIRISQGLSLVAAPLH